MTQQPSDSLQQREPGFSVGAVLLVIVGLLLLLQTTGVLSWRLWTELLRYWPVLLIAAGVSLLLGRRAPYLAGASVVALFLAAILLAAVTVGPPADTGAAGDRIDRVVAFGDATPTVTSQAFQGGDVTAAFGSIELDLRQAGLAPQAGTLRVTALFGSVDVRVPSEWNLRIERRPVLGSVEDTRRIPASPQGGPTLVIDATAAFGSVTISR